MDGFNADALVACFKQNTSAIPEQFSMPQGRTSATESGEATIARKVAATSGSAGEEGDANEMDISSGDEMLSQAASSDAVESSAEEVS